MTGDGGWAGLDQELAARLAANGVPTVGLNSLKYFWRERTPEETAGDVARILRHYLSAWNKKRVLLVGYSFGADVLPFVVNRLPSDLRERIASVSLLGIDANASFEVRIAEWVGADNGGAPTRPEARAHHAAAGAVPLRGGREGLDLSRAARRRDRARTGRQRSPLRRRVRHPRRPHSRLRPGTPPCDITRRHSPRRPPHGGGCVPERALG